MAQYEKKVCPKTGVTKLTPVRPKAPATPKKTKSIPKKMSKEA